MRNERLVVIFGDIEMGAEGALDDFPHAAFLGELLLDYARGPQADGLIDVVFNGDTFDFLKIALDGGWPYHISKAVALRKLELLLAHHRPFVEAVDAFIQKGQGRYRVHFVVGNHDAELLFPAVQRALREACGGHEEVRFPGNELSLGPLHVEHGHQFDPLFQIDPARPFTNVAPEPLLNLSWAAIGLLSIVMPLHPELYFYDRLAPRRTLFALVPELRDLFTGLAWRYWTKDFWHAFLVQKDPLLRFDWTMAKEVVKRIALRNTDVAIDSDELTESIERSNHQLFVTGHLHDLGHRQLGVRRLVKSGAMRDEYHIGDGGTSFHPAFKCFVEVRVDDDRVLGLTTRELLGPARPPEHQLETVFDLLPNVRTHLAALGDQSKEEAARRLQERAEAQANAAGASKPSA